MKTVKFTTVTLLILALLALTGWLYYSEQTKNEGVAGILTSSSSATEWQKAIENCIPELKNPTTTLYTEYGTSQCVEKIMQTAYETQSLENMITGLQTVVDNDLNFYVICHAAAHEAGYKAGKSIKNVKETLDSAAKSTVCDWGMGHGIFDAVAANNPGEDSFMELASWCEEQKSDPILHNLCLDGLGHLALKGGGNLENAVQLCDQLSDDSTRMRCGSGIVMEIYGTELRATWSRDLESKTKGIIGNEEKLHQEQVQLCKQWEEYAQTQGTLNGCFYGASFMYGMYFVEAVVDYWNSPVYREGPELPTAVLQDIDNIYVENSKKCRDYTNDTQEICYKGLGNFRQLAMCKGNDWNQVGSLSKGNAREIQNSIYCQNAGGLGS